MRNSKDGENGHHNNEFNDEPGWDDNESPDLSELRNLFETELGAMYCIENALVEAWPNLIKYATSPTLTETLTDHLQCTYKHVAKLFEIHSLLGKDIKQRECETVKSILRQAEDVISHSRKGLVRDAAIILVAKKIEHYEISIYDTLYAYAMILGEKKVACMLNQNLEDEKRTDLNLTAVSASFINPNTI